MIWDRYENLSPKEYLDVIRPYLIDLINEHKWTVELNNTNSNNNTNNSNNNTNHSNNNTNHSNNNTNNSNINTNNSNNKENDRAE